MRPITRRAAIQSLAAASALSIIRPLTADPAPAGPKFAVRSPLTGNTLRERAELAARCGYTGIEIGGGEWFAPSPNEILESLKGTGIQVSAASALQNHLDPDPEVRKASIIENKHRLVKARDIGATALVCVTVFGKKSRFQDLSPILTPRDIEFRLMVHALTELAPVAEKVGVKLILEPLTQKESHFINRQQEGLELIQQVNSPAVGLLSDFYHMQMEESDIPAALLACAGKTFYVHVADGEKRTVAGSLPFDYRPGFGVLKKLNYSGWITSEAAAAADTEKALMDSLVYLKSQWKEARN